MLLLAGAGAVMVGMIVNAASPRAQYRDAAERFDAAGVQADIAALASPAAEGRETGMPGARIAAAYIAERMESAGLFPAGVGNTYLQALVRPRFHVTEVPTLEVLNSEGAVAQAFTYRQDFSESPTSRYLGIDEPWGTTFSGPVFGCTLGSGTDLTQEKVSPLQDETGIAIILEGSGCPVSSRSELVALVVPKSPERVERKTLFPATNLMGRNVDASSLPVLLISRQTADVLLATAGSSLAELEAMRETLPRATLGTTGRGAQVRIKVNGAEGTRESGEYINVLGVLPGTGAEIRQAGGRGLDQQVIIVSAYYDGLGILPDGQLYPGANDNASAVAMMLEMARQMTASPYQPEKTVLFIAWAGGERYEGLSLVEVMNAKIGFNTLTVEAVIELSGVGAGTLDQAAIGTGSSFRLVQLFQDAAHDFDLKSTTRGRGPHFGMPVGAGFGERSAMTLNLSWDGSDQTAHTPQDTPDLIDPSKLEKLGRSALLTLLILSRETGY